jgi:hypothetical protein
MQVHCHSNRCWLQPQINDCLYLIIRPIELQPHASMPRFPSVYTSSLGLLTTILPVHSTASWRMKHTTGTSRRADRVAASRSIQSRAGSHHAQGQSAVLSQPRQVCVTATKPVSRRLGGPGGRSLVPAHLLGQVVVLTLDRPQVEYQIFQAPKRPVAFL